MDDELNTTPEGVSTAALASALLKRGLKNIWLPDSSPMPQVKSVWSAPSSHSDSFLFERILQVASQCQP